MSHPRRILLAVLSEFAIAGLILVVALSAKSERPDSNITVYERIKEAAILRCEERDFVGYEYIGQHYKKDSDGWYEVTFTNEVGETLLVYVYGKSVFESVPVVRDTVVEGHLSSEVTAYSRESLMPNEWCLAFTNIYGVPQEDWAPNSSLEDVMQKEVLRTDWYLAVMDENSVSEACERLSKQIKEKGLMGSIHARSFSSEEFVALNDSMQQVFLRDLFEDSLWINVA